jgi:hypothetical protein
MTQMIIKLILVKIKLQKCYYAYNALYGYYAKIKLGLKFFSVRQVLNKLNFWIILFLGAFVKLLK